MNAEIIAVGTELTTGDITDTNGAFLSKELSDLGINVVGQTVVPDDAKRIIAALGTAISRSQLVIFTGGLGPTPDDMTKETICTAVGLSLVENEESLQRIKAYFDRKGVEMAEANRKQALFPQKAIILPNAVGTADGCVIESGNQSIIMLPGPPNEMKRMYEDGVLPYITKKLDRVVVTKTLKVFGMGESNIADKLGDILKSTDPVVATYAGKGDIRIKITATGMSKGECVEKYEPVVAVIKDLLGNVIYAEDNTTIAQVVVDELKNQGKMISAAESCTGGLVSKMITDVSGASRVFEYGVSAYANRVKTDVLGVSEELLLEKGAVSVEVAEAMAEGVKKVSGADFGVATTGYASGGEGVPEDKVGLVYISLCDGEKVFTRKIMAGHGTNDRDRVRLAAAMNCFDMARLYLRDDKSFLATGRILKKEEEPVLEEKVVIQDEIKEQENIIIEDTQEDVDLNSIIFSYDEEKAEEEIPQNTFELEDAEENVEVDLKDTDDQQENKKKVGFFKSLFPCKGDAKKDIIRKIAALLCIAVFIGSGVYIGDYYYKGYKNKKLTNELTEMFYNTTSQSDGMAERFAELSKINPDIVGWLKVPGIKTDNPVVKSPTDTASTYKYLYKDFYGKYSSYGTLFAKYNNTFDGELSRNTTIYGHHMKDGQMFGELKNFRNLEFYKQHPVIEFTPAYSDNIVKWKIFSIMLVDTTLTPKHGEIYDYSKANFVNNQEFLAFVDEAYQRSIIDTTVQDITKDDKILTLSTCAYDFTGARFVVMARMVREGESTEVDVESATNNADVVYPKVHKSAKNGNTTVTPYSPSSEAESSQSSSVESSQPESSQEDTNENDNYYQPSYDDDQQTEGETSSVGTHTDVG